MRTWTPECMEQGALARACVCVYVCMCLVCTGTRCEWQSRDYTMSLGLEHMSTCSSMNITSSRTCPHLINIIIIIIITRSDVWLECSRAYIIVTRVGRAWLECTAVCLSVCVCVCVCVSVCLLYTTYVCWVLQYTSHHCTYKFSHCLSQLLLSDLHLLDVPELIQYKTQLASQCTAVCTVRRPGTGQTSALQSLPLPANPTYVQPVNITWLYHVIPAQYLWSSGLLCHRPSDLELTTWLDSLLRPGSQH